MHITSICCQYFQILGRALQGIFFFSLLALLKLLTSLIYSEQSPIQAKISNITIANSCIAHSLQILHTSGQTLGFPLYIFGLFPVHTTSTTWIIQHKPSTQSNSQYVPIVATGYCYLCNWVWWKCTGLWVRSVTPFSSSHGILCIGVEGGQKMHHVSACPNKPGLPRVPNGHLWSSRQIKDCPLGPTPLPPAVLGARPPHQLEVGPQSGKPERRRHRSQAGGLAL